MGLPRADVNRSPTSGSRLSLRAAGPGQAAQESESDSERVARTAPAARLQPVGRLAACAATGRLSRHWPRAAALRLARRIDRALRGT